MVNYLGYMVSYLAYMVSDLGYKVKFYRSFPLEKG